MLLGYSRAGMEFMFGGLVGPTDSLGFIFAFSVLPVVIFFSSLIAVLYHARIMQWMIQNSGGGLRKLLRTSHTESSRPRRMCLSVRQKRRWWRGPTFPA